MHTKTLYVLNLGHSRKYVGLTTDLHKRWHQHVSGLVCQWTRRFKPRCVSLVRTVDSRHAEEEEAQLTAQLVLQHGVNHVRGANLTAALDYRRREDDMHSVAECLSAGLGMCDHKAWAVTKQLFGTALGGGEVRHDENLGVLKQRGEAGRLAKREVNPQQSHAAGCARCNSHRCRPARTQCHRCGSRYCPASIMQQSPAASSSYNGYTYSVGSGFGNERYGQAERRYPRSASKRRGSDNFSNASCEHGSYSRGSHDRNESESGENSSNGYWHQSSVSSDYSQFQDLSSERSSDDWRMGSEYRGCTDDRKNASYRNSCETYRQGYGSLRSNGSEDGGRLPAFEREKSEGSFRDESSSDDGRHGDERANEYNSQDEEHETENVDQYNEYLPELGNRYVYRADEESEEEYSSGDDESGSEYDQRTWTGISTQEEPFGRYSTERDEIPNYHFDDNDESLQDQYSDDEPYSQYKSPEHGQDLEDASFRSESDSEDYDGDEGTGSFDDWDENSDYEDHFSGFELQSEYHS